MQLIALTQGQVAKVDDADYDWLCQWKWYAVYSKYTKSYYARRSLNPGVLYMSRAILGLTDPKVQADHRNKDTLDNQRHNLRVATASQNKSNIGKLSCNTSGFKGVTWVSTTKRWRAQMRRHGKHIHLGYFATAEEAHEAYKAKARELHGEFARF